MMRGVSPPGARGTGLRALAGAGLWILTGCGVVIDEPQLDMRAEQRPGTWVRRLETEISNLRGAYDNMTVNATPSQRRRLPSIGSELSRLADYAASMKDDLDWKRGRFGEHLAQAESVAVSIDNQLRGAPVTSAVRARWYDTAYALGYVREFYRSLGPERLYQVQEDPRGIVKLSPAAPKGSDYDASSDVDRVRRGYDQVMKAWRDAPARRAAAGWAGQLDRELASLGDPVSALTRVNTSEPAAVAPVAERVRQQVERVRPLVEAREAELPRAMLEGWQQMSGSVQSLGKP
jgi:hypothetical protein